MVSSLIVPLIISLISLITALGANTSTATTHNDKKVFVVIFENTDGSDALKRPFFANLAREGVYLNKMYHLARPSQPNYIGLVSGDVHKVKTNNPVNLSARSIVDLLEANGKSWKVYLEDYPGNCFTGASTGKYARKHNPFISFDTIQKNPARCSRLVSADQLQKDVQAETVSDFSFFVPNMDSGGHDKGIDFADQWFEKTFSPLLADARFTKDLILITTFDESGKFWKAPIYTSFWGEGIASGKVLNEKFDLYSLLRTIEATLGIGTLGLKDSKAKVIQGIWSSP